MFPAASSTWSQMSSSAPARRYMSSRSKGVTNVRFRRFTTSCVSRSPSCSRSLMSRIRSCDPFGAWASRSTRAREIATAFADAWLNSWKNSLRCGTRLIRAIASSLVGRRESSNRFAPLDRPRLVLPWTWKPMESPVFQAFCGAGEPAFANRAELECAKVLDYYGIPWEYEPRTFVLEEGADGRVVEAFTPDFYLPEQDLYLEITMMKQSLVTRKNRKLRKLRERYPETRIKLFYRRDVERLAERYHLQLAS